MKQINNKTLYGALTRWAIQIRTLLYMITHNTYSTQLFQLRFKVLPQLSGKVENECERLNTVLKCCIGPTLPYITSTVLEVQLYLVRYNPSSSQTVSRQLVRTFPYARIKLCFKTFKITYFWAQNTIKMKRKVR